MGAYFGQEEMKANLVAQLEDDFQHGRIVQGDYWNGECGGLIGCATRDSSHALYERMYNIPRSFAHLFDRIFEGLPLKEAQQFTLDVHKSIPVGADLSLVLSRFLLWLLADSQDGVIRFAQLDQGKTAIEQVAALYQRKLAGDTPTGEEWWAAAAAAATTATSANGAASYTAAAVGNAVAHAYAAAAAAAAAATYATAAYAEATAYAAARVADAAAAAAAEATAYAAAAADTAFYTAYRKGKLAHFRKMRDKLLSLLVEAPVLEVQARQEETQQ